MGAVFCFYCIYVFVKFFFGSHEREGEREGDRTRGSYVHARSQEAERERFVP